MAQVIVASQIAVDGTRWASLFRHVCAEQHSAHDAVLSASEALSEVGGFAELSLR